MRLPVESSVPQYTPSEHEQKHAFGPETVTVTAEAPIPTGAELLKLIPPVPRAPRAPKNLPFMVKPYHAAKRPHLKFEVRGRANGKLKRNFFAKEDEAKTFAQLRNTEALQYGTESAATPLWLRVAADECQAALAPHGKTIRDATAHYIAFLEARKRSCTVEALFAQLVDTKRAAGVSKIYLCNVKRAGRDFAAAFPGKIVSEFEARDIDDFLSALRTKNAVSRNYWRQIICVAFSFAKKRGFCQVNVAEASYISKVVQSPVGILHPDQLARLLAQCPADILPAVAVGAFAGLRTAEIVRLDWREVNLAGGFVEVTAKNAKSSKRRLVKIAPCLLEWLRPFAKQQGRITPEKTAFYILREEAAKRAGIAAWPSNALRHSFASYHIAQFKNANALALEMGHTTTKMIFAHYYEVVRPESADEYWKITPFSRPETMRVLAFTPQGFVWCLNLFRVQDEFLEGSSALARYFGVEHSTVYYWFKNPESPRPRADGKFFIQPWREFVEKHAQSATLEKAGNGRPWFVARTLANKEEKRHYFATEDEARQYADATNAERLGKAVRLGDAGNVVRFDASAASEAPATVTA